MRRRKILLFIMVVSMPAFFAAGSGDFDNDYRVDINDLAIFVGYWLYDYEDNQKCSSWDLYENGVIDINDLAVITEQWLTDYDFIDFSEFARYWRKAVDYRFQDKRFDLNGDGRVDWGDFSAFSTEWLIDPHLCDDMNTLGTWEDMSFTGIGSCDMYDCWFSGGERSGYEYDDCRNFLYVECMETPDLDYYCGYNFFFDNTRVGLCIYACGLNYFQVMKNVNQTRILRTRHRTQDQLYYGCDEGTTNRYDWQVVVYDDVNGTKTGYCRESYQDPSVKQYWDPNQGNSSDCENDWW